MTNRTNSKLYSLIEVSSSNPPPEPNASLTIPEILANALVSVMDRSQGLFRGMGIIQTIRPGRWERTTTPSDMKLASEMEWVTMRMVFLVLD